MVLAPFLYLTTKEQSRMAMVLSDDLNIRALELMAEDLICEGPKLDIQGGDNANELIINLFKAIGGYSHRITVYSLVWVLRHVVEDGDDDA
jgi:hypothetical protein